MTLSAAAPALGAVVGGALGTLPSSLTGWNGIFGTLADWLATNTIILPGAPPTGMKAVGSACEGKGVFSFAKDETDLGPALAKAVGSTDAKAKEVWTSIAKAILKHLTDNGEANPTAFAASPTGGPVSGTGTVTLNGSGSTLGTEIADAVPANDAAGIAGWKTFATSVVTLVTAAQLLATPIGFASPNGGGPLTGTGTII